MGNSSKNMLSRAVSYSLVGWFVFFLVMVLFLGPVGSGNDWIPIYAFMAFAPGVITGIIIAYITSKNEKKESQSPTLQQVSRPEKS